MARNEIAKKVYVTPTGEVTHAQPDVTKMEFRFSDGTTVTVDRTKLGKNVQAAAFWHGISQKLGDSYAGAESVDEAIESIETLLERLGADDWVKAREAAGPRPTMVVDAVVAALIAAGQKVDDARRAKIAEKLKTNDARQAALKDARVSAEYEKLRAAKAAERAKAAADKAKTTPVGTGLDSF